MQHLDIEEINSLLLEELLGISNKRLKYIFNGQNSNEDSSSSTDPEEENKPIDLISLDDVSDDDLIVELDSETEKGSKKKRHKIKKEHSSKRVKKEKSDKKTAGENLGEENLMSVLELLELQARARAIKSQLMLEASKKNQQSVNATVENSTIIHDKEDDDDEIIINIPNDSEIVITSSESEGDKEEEANVSSRSKKITLIRDRIVSHDANSGKAGKSVDSKNTVEETTVSPEKADQNAENVNTTTITTQSTCEGVEVQETNTETAEVNVNKENCESNPQNAHAKGQSEGECTDDEIILIADQEEIDGLMES